MHIQFVDKPVFNSALNTKTKRNTGRLEYVVFYDGFEREGYWFDEIAKNKAAAYTTSSDRAILRRYLSYFEFQDFLVHKGDSLVMSFDPAKPVVIKHAAGTYAPHDLNVEAIINQKYPGAYLTAGMADDTRMTAFKYFFDDPKESERQSARKGYEKGLYLETLENQMGSDLLPSANDLKRNSQQVLDSLHAHKHISDDVYRFYQQKYAHLPLKLAIMSGSMDSTQAARALTGSFKNLRFQDTYFNQCLDHFEKKYITSRAQWTVANHYYFRDPKESFSLAQHSSLLSPAVKDQLLFLSLGKIDNFFPDETDTYLKAFVNSVTDARLIQQAQAKYERDKLLNTTPSDLHLMAFNREQFTIEEVLEQKKGKVVYLDFWASWCAPCIEEMKYSKSILQDYEHKNLEVVFFSLDDNYMKWSKAAERLEINLTENSFKILKPEGSKFIQEHKLGSIPRYMVVGKDGKIINANAPRPSDPKIRKVLDALVAE
ncbi:hypothetical protein GCM10027275_51910 [Rhabdobacter roseus]